MSKCGGPMNEALRRDMGENCRDGYFFNSFWGDEGDAWECATKLMQETNTPHWVYVASADAELPVGSVDEYTIVGDNVPIECKAETTYSSLTDRNDVYAKGCAKALNYLAQLTGQPAQYEAKIIKKRFFLFSDIYQVAKNL